MEGRKGRKEGRNDGRKEGKEHVYSTIDDRHKLSVQHKESLMLNKEASATATEMIII